MHSKYDNMHKNRMLYAIIYISNHIITSINYMFLGATLASFAQRRKITPNRSNQEGKREKAWGIGEGEKKNKRELKMERQCVSTRGGEGKSV